MEKILALYSANEITEIQSWIKGVEGEQETARYLGLLGPEWKTLHAIPFGSSGKDLDHLVIGPTGVFVINSKNHQSANALVSGGKIIIGRQPWPEPEYALRDANHVAEILSNAVGFPVPATGVVSLVGVNRITIGDEYPVAAVLHARGLARMIRQSRPNQGLSDTQVDALYLAACNSKTWGTTQQHEPEYILSRYEALLAELRSSMIYQSQWSAVSAQKHRKSSFTPKQKSKVRSRKSKGNPVQALMGLIFLITALKFLGHHG